MIGIMYKLRHFVSRELMVSLYYSLIYPYLIYGVPIWGTANITTLSTLHILQKQIVRLITFNDGYALIPGPLMHTPPLFHELKILNIYDICKLEINKFTFTVINRISPPQFYNMFTQLNEVNSMITRSTNENKLFIYYARTSHYGLTLIKNIGARLWNAMPTALRMVNSKAQFNKKLKTYFISLYV